jgi:lipopolysaccharide biosynthesis glycosyltransferase
MGMFNKNKDKVLVTVCTQHFLAGTLVLLHSFLQHNPWFKGDIVVINDGSIPESGCRLLQGFPNLRFVKVSATLLEKSKKLIPSFPDFERRLGQFYSLEAFQLKDYAQLLFLDSDMVVRGSLEELFERKEDFLVCPTATHYKQPKAYVPEDPFSVEQFNAGMMLMRKHLLKENLYEKMLSKVSVPFFSSFLPGQSLGPNDDAVRLTADQLIHNSLLHPFATYVSMRYNYRLGLAEKIKEREGIGIEDSYIVHFTGKKKPWLLSESLTRMQESAENAKAYNYWAQAYVALQASILEGNTFFQNK